MIFSWLRRLFKKKAKDTPKPVTPTPPPAPVKKRRKRPKKRRCPVTDKYCYTREFASKERDRLVRERKATKLRTYCCEFCGHWHLTSKRRKKY